MRQNRSLKQRMLAAVLTLAMLVSSLLGTTFAWFTDQVTSEGNKIEAGNLSIDLSHKYEDAWVSLKQNPDHKVFNYNKWEPGYTRVEALRVDNLGSLALQYRLSLEMDYGTATLGDKGEKLADVIEVYVTTGESAPASYEALKTDWTYKGTLATVMKKPAEFLVGELLPTGKVLDANASASTKVGSETFSIALHMQEDAGNEYQNLTVGDVYVNLVATQWSYENDGFGTDYDSNPVFPELDLGDVAMNVNTLNNIVQDEVNATGTGVNATVPAGVAVDEGVTKLTLSVQEKADSDANITLNDGEALRALDVHIEGVSKNNTVPMYITVEKAMKPGLNFGNYTLYHVENGVSNEMTVVATLAELDAHNEIYYDPATGDVTLAMATFSEVAFVAEYASAWKGGVDHNWYSANTSQLVIANADQLWSFSQIVGGMAEGIEQDSFAGKTVKLAIDINIADTDSENGLVFYPVGYYNSDYTYERTPGTAITSGFMPFEGTFDGDGHVIANFYQNTWEMKGDHDWYSNNEQYYRDGMGLFGKVYGGTVKNLTIENFSSDGEITTTGTIAAYADHGAAFENIAIFNCNPRVYNIGNGGIVGCVGWYNKEATDQKVTFKNITVDNSNKVSALWGSWDVACGGIVGQYYPVSGQTSAGSPANAGIHMENCHVGAQIDVYNDVCANYQYYAYRYAGMLIGSVRENETIDGHVYPKMDGITATDCTVHFGDWNDYYYCELVANSLASYTHDHQMSRLEQVKEVNGTTITPLEGASFTVPASGRYNYVVVKEQDANGWVHGDGAEFATCYHFVDGKVWNHADAGTETVGGETVLKEDKQLVYREFNQLVTGYGWGVTSKGVGEMDGVDILDRATADSVKKFNGKVTKLYTNTTYSLGDIFSLIENTGVKLVNGALTVTVTNLDANGNVTATLKRHATDWASGTIKFANTGKVRLTIQDYYFCEPTYVDVDISEMQFETLFTQTPGSTYKVGNRSNIELSSWFTPVDLSIPIGADTPINVTVTRLDGDNTATYTAQASSINWGKSTISLGGTGLFKVTINGLELVVESVESDAPVNLYLGAVAPDVQYGYITGETTGGNKIGQMLTVPYGKCLDYISFGRFYTYGVKGDVAVTINIWSWTHGEKGELLYSSDCFIYDNATNHVIDIHSNNVVGTIYYEIQAKDSSVKISACGALNGNIEGVVNYYQGVADLGYRFANNGKPGSGIASTIGVYDRDEYNVTLYKGDVTAAGQYGGTSGGTGNSIGQSLTIPTGTRLTAITYATTLTYGNSSVEGTVTVWDSIEKTNVLYEGVATFTDNSNNHTAVVIPENVVITGDIYYEIKAPEGVMFAVRTSTEGPVDGVVNYYNGVANEGKSGFWECGDTSYGIASTITVAYNPNYVAPGSEEVLLYSGETIGAQAADQTSKSFGQQIVIPDGKAMDKISIWLSVPNSVTGTALGTLKIYEWNADYATTTGENSRVLYEAKITGVNQRWITVELDVLLTGTIFWEITADDAQQIIIPMGAAQFPENITVTNYIVAADGTISNTCKPNTANADGTGTPIKTMAVKINCIDKP